MTFGFGSRDLEHFHECCSDALEALIGSGVFGFWLRFGSVTGFFKPAPSPKPRQKPKTLAPHRYIISVNALKVRRVFHLKTATEDSNISTSVVPEGGRGNARVARRAARESDGSIDLNTRGSPRNRATPG